MLLKLAVLALLALSAYGQNVNVGGGAIPGYVADTFCTGTVFTVPGQSGPYSTLRYSATSMTCDVPEPNGTCTVSLDLIENRPAGPNPATDSAIGTRLFTIAVNGTNFGTMDIFGLVGALKPLVQPLPPVQVTDGHLRIVATAQKGNASIAGLEIACQPTPVPPFSQNADGSWKFTGDLAVTGYLETGFLGNQPARLTLRMPDGSSVDGTSGVLTIGACRITLQAGSVVGVTGCQ